jgi:uncharacterized protein (TIGR00255 family)
MAVYSMTGYASAAAAIATGTSQEIQLSVEIRSVNSRFLDISFRLPDELRQAEPALRTLITANIKRGKVEVRAGLENALQNLPVKPSVTMLTQLQTIQKDIQSTLKDARGLSVADVMRLAGSQGNVLENGDEATQSMLKLTQTVVVDLLASREREGARLTLPPSAAACVGLASRAADSCFSGSTTREIHGSLERSFGYGYSDRKG